MKCDHVYTYRVMHFLLTDSSRSWGAEKLSWLRAFHQLPWRDEDRSKAMRENVALRFYHKLEAQVMRISAHPTAASSEWPILYIRNIRFRCMCIRQKFFLYIYWWVCLCVCLFVSRSWVFISWFELCQHMCSQRAQTGTISMRLAHFFDLKIYLFAKAPSRFLPLCQTLSLWGVPVVFVGRTCVKTIFGAGLISVMCSPSAVKRVLGLVLVYTTWIHLEIMSNLCPVFQQHIMLLKSS